MKGPRRTTKSGLTAVNDTRGFDFYGKLSYDLAALRLADILGRAVFYTGPWRFSTEFTWRQPSVRANTLFSMIDFYRYREIRSEIQRRIYKNLSLLAQFQVDIFNEENSYRSGLGVRTGGYSLLWVHQNGYGGDDDGVQGFAMVRLNRNWDLYAGANFNRYRVQELQETRNDNYSANVGMRRIFGQGLAGARRGTVFT